MKIINKVALLILSSTLLISCSKSSQTTDASFSIQTSALFSDGADGTIIINGTNGVDTFQEVIPSSQTTFEVELPRGSWSIKSVAWISTSAAELNLAGKVRCALNTINVDGSDFQSDINLTAANCTKAPFKSSAINLNGYLRFRPINLQPCINFNGATYTGECLSNERKRGMNDTFRVGLNSYNTITKSFKREYVSGCITPENNPTNLGLPFDGTIPVFSFIIYAYEDEDCNTTDGNGRIDNAYYIGKQSLEDQRTPKVYYKLINHAQSSSLYFADNIIGAKINPLLDAMPILRSDCNDGSGSHCLNTTIAFSNSDHLVEGVYKNFSHIFGTPDNVSYYNDDGEDEGILQEISRILGGPIGAILYKEGISTCTETISNIGKRLIIELPFSGDTYELRIESPTNPSNFAPNLDIRLVINSLDSATGDDQQIFEVSCANNNGYYASKDLDDEGLRMTEFHYRDIGTFNDSRYELIQHSSGNYGVSKHFISIHGRTGNTFDMFSANIHIENSGDIHYNRNYVEAGAGTIEVIQNSIDETDASTITNFFSFASGDSSINSGAQTGQSYDDGKFTYSAAALTGPGVISISDNDYDTYFTNSLIPIIEGNLSVALSYDYVFDIENQFTELSP